MSTCYSAVRDPELVAFLDELDAMRHEAIDCEASLKTTMADWRAVEVLLPIHRQKSALWRASWLIGKRAPASMPDRAKAEVLTD